MNGVARAGEKTDLWLRWLAHWHVSAHPIYLRLMGLKSERAGRHYEAHTRWVKRGYVRSAQVPGRTRAFSVYAATANGLATYGLTGSALSQQGLERILDRRELVHDLAVQWYVAGFGAAAVELVRAERKSGAGDAVGSAHPDAVLPLATPLAIEVELRQKAESRIYRHFLAHAEAFAQGRYGRVRYVFADAALRDNYMRRFAAESWPHYVYDVSSKRYRATTEPYEMPASHPARARFEFVLEPLWPLTNFSRTT